MPSKSAPTLRARRTGRVPRENSLDRTRLVSDPDVTIDAKQSPMKSVVWFLVVIVLALVTYLGLKTYLTDNTDETLEPTLTPTSAEVEQNMVSSNVLADDPIEPFTNSTYWNQNSKQIQSTSTEDAFVIENVMVQPHESYISFIYELSGGSVSDFPQVTAEMLDDIILTFENISLNSSSIEVEETVSINLGSVTSLTRTEYSEQIDMYLIDLIEKKSFALYSKVEDDRKLVILDVLSPANDDVAPTTQSTPTPTSGVSATPLPAGAENYNNEYSQNEQKIVSSVSGKTVKITKYNYFDSSDMFTYNLVLSDGIPNAVASLVDNTLTLEVSNLVLDGVVGNGGSGSTDLSATGVVHVQKVEISNSDGVSKYVFTLDGARDFRLNADEENNLMTLEIKR
ncbi:hypothetical protein KC675_04010 [Candidatus Dojkabacteria bacterium]|uniref:Uncharacterized protein n=1 Tax=Candidatus Dojkabacteria bacterium TaxID=2099670 RepID=A0A955L1C8_9BACT|nr:hypothetical protein [Candidatus Dojkabacteria bacterium]